MSIENSPGIPSRIPIEVSSRILLGNLKVFFIQPLENSQELLLDFLKKFLLEFRRLSYTIPLFGLLDFDENFSKEEFLA